MLDIHIKHNYTVNVETLDENTLIVHFPRNIFAELDDCTVLFTIVDDGVALENEFASETIKCPDYLIRPLIYKIIATSVLNRYIELDLIIGSKEIQKLRGPSDLDKEQEMYNLLMTCLQDDSLDITELTENSDLNTLLTEGYLL